MKNNLPHSVFFFFFSLQDHPFIMQYNDGNTEVVSMWVCRSLEERKIQQAQRLMWTAAAPDGILGVHISSLYSSTEPRETAADPAAPHIEHLLPTLS